ncbi:MAG: hypothetical protein LBS45_11470 [Synergistaceae bacterium]|jgi:hypothetical protein|nr:hypothetical protein [Synergistaceae bacterium]
MYERGEEKIWIVVTIKDEDGRPNVSAYDNESDANNYLLEMRARYGENGVFIQETTINSRDSSLQYIDAPWGFLRMDLKSEFVEGLMEDMAPAGAVKSGAAEMFAATRAEEVGRRMAKRVENIVMDETLEELKAYDEWRCCPDMED